MIELIVYKFPAILEGLIICVAVFPGYQYLLRMQLHMNKIQLSSKNR